MPSAWNTRPLAETLVLFDVDGTLSLSRQKAKPDMLALLAKLREKAVIGFVGGSDLVKQQEQLGENALLLFDYGFSENGVTAYKDGKLMSQSSFIEYLGEDRYKELINFCLRYMANIDIPKKRGTFVEFRKGMVNLSPIGRSCSQKEREEFNAIDAERGIRTQFVKALEEKFPHFNLKFSIGGQISIDVFPAGWDKTYCLRHVANEGFTTIHFFGDMTEKGGNDYEIFNHPSVMGHKVKDPEDTMNQLRQLFDL